jgi:5-methylcytosine-specific restriction endonuclease McrA
MTTAYLRYLQSPEWYQQRRRALHRAGYRCERCGMGRELEVHHRHYWTLGDEEPEDLEVLCHRCHRNEHLLCNRAPRMREQLGQARLFDRWVDPNIFMNPKKEAA